jgi:polyisoprenyl-phosphate glycosyltransferase
MSTNKPDISVVVPVFNSEHSLKDLFIRTSKVLSALNVTFEIIFVDDRSVDDSWHTIRQLKTEGGDHVRGFKLARNSGQQAATVCGLQHAKGSWVVTLDDDLQSLPEEIPKLWERANGQQIDVVYGVSPTLKHRFLHNLGSRIFRIILRRVAPNVPAGSSFRLIKGEILRSFPERHGPWIFVDPALAWLTSDIATVNVSHGERKDGRSGYSLGSLVGMALTVLVVYSTFPLQIITWIGLLSALISFCLGIYYLTLKLTTRVAIGFSALIVTMTFAFGVIMLSLGILGIYISRIYVMGSGQPAFTIKSEI